jgi:peptide/nickel transport system ATP-binding protein
MTATAAEVEGLRIVLAGGVDVVSDVALQLEEGEVVGLVGESGSGKTTVGLALLGHSRRGTAIAAGTVRVCGNDLLTLSPRALRRLRGQIVAYVPQDPAAALNPALRVGTQLMETLAAHSYGVDDRERRARIAELVGEVSLGALPDLLRRYPHQLSGGQQQRVALAIAFACRPRLIVLDEPTTGLDVTTQAHILDTVRQLCRVHRVAALYITHDLAVVAGLADRVLVMYSGRIVERGLTDSLFNAPAHPYTARLIDAVPDLRGARRLDGIAGNAPAPRDRPAGCPFAPRCHLVIDECRTAMPGVAQVDPNHDVRCYRWHDVNRRADSAGLDKRLTVIATAPDTEMLHLDNVAAWYGRHAVVEGITLTVARAECLAIVGESGSGKTTLARSIAGLHSQTSGFMEFEGRPLSPHARDRQPAVRQGIQYIFQNPYGSLNPRWTIAETVGQPLRIFFRLERREADRRVTAALERVTLPRAIRHQYPDQLSGGERQRVAIARAIAAEPKLLICDEVTSALDVSVQASIVTLLDELRRDSGLGLIFVTHNLALIRSVAQRGAVMSRGRIVESGSVQDLLDRPTSDYTRRLLADTPTFDTKGGGA